MAWTSYQKMLAAVMVFTGTINTLSTKWADNLDAPGRDGLKHPFDHPFFQACCMFVGELSCLLLFQIMMRLYSARADGSEDMKELTRGNRSFNRLLLWAPAMCDMCATSLMYIGLNLTYASSFQMLRGSVICFVALLSVGFLERQIGRREWLGIGAVCVGLALVGVADFLSKGTSSNSTSSGHSRNDIITGDLLIIIAQVITAIQMVIEELYVKDRDIPALQAVGWEGLFGFVTLALLHVPLFYIKGGAPFTTNPNGSLEDVYDALLQMAHNWRLMVAVGGMVVSIAFFNFAGISVTKEMSATTRMVLDSVRTVLVWAFSLAFMDQAFHWLQLVGFIFLIYGMCLYHNITCLEMGRSARRAMASLRYRRMRDLADLPQTAAPDEIPQP